MQKQIKQDVAELIIEMQQQLVSLERKIDVLIGRSPDRPSGGGQHGVAKQNRDLGERVRYKAICADCNKECEVPFRPSHDRPVYCRECFSSRKGGSSFHTNRDNRPKEKDFAQQRPFEKYRGGENRRSAGKKKPTFKSAKNKKMGMRDGKR